MGKNNVTTNFFNVSVKMAENQLCNVIRSKNKCLVLSKYPHSDPHTNLTIGDKLVETGS